MTKPATPPKPPYFAVIFTSQRSSNDGGYAAMAERMVALASAREGFLGIESARGADGLGITVSYWSSLESIHAWKADAEHRVAQARGRELWYDAFELRIAEVRSHRRFVRDVGGAVHGSSGQECLG